MIESPARIGSPNSTFHPCRQTAAREARDMLEDMLAIAKSRGESRRRDDPSIRAVLRRLRVRVQRVGVAGRGAIIRDHFGADGNRIGGLEDTPDDGVVEVDHIRLVWNRRDAQERRVNRDGVPSPASDYPLLLQPREVAVVESEHSSINVAIVLTQ